MKKSVGLSGRYVQKAMKGSPANAVIEAEGNPGTSNTCSRSFCRQTYHYILLCTRLERLSLVVLNQLTYLLSLAAAGGFHVLYGWYPELVFIPVVFSNSTNLAVVILNSSVLKIYFVKYVEF